MKKFLNLILVVSLVFINLVVFANVVNAEESFSISDGNEVLDRINSSEPAARDLIQKLTTWSNSYSESMKDLIEHELIEDLDTAVVISKLRSRGHGDAADALESIKSSIDYDIDYLKTTLKMVKYYNDNDIETDDVEDVDLYYGLRGLFRKVKKPLSTLGRIYYDSYYDEISNKIDTLDDYNELIDLYKEITDKYYNSSKLTAKLDKFKNYYLSKDLYLYEPMLKDELRSYYNTFKTDYNTLYDKLEAKLQTKLDERLDNIIDPVDKTNVSEVIEANKKIYNIMDKINSVKEDAIDEFTKFNNLFSGIDIVLEYAGEYQETIKTRLQEAYDYTKSKLIELDLLVTVKKESDKKYIKLDNETGLIVYDSNDLAPATLINKLSTTYGSMRVTKAYDAKVGTKSHLEVFYESDVLKDFIIVVRGDIAPTGKIDITDLVKLCDKMFGVANLDKYQMIAADFDDNNKVDITDLVKLCDKIYG